MGQVFKDDNLVKMHCRGSMGINKTGRRKERIVGEKNQHTDMQFV